MFRKLQTFRHVFKKSLVDTSYYPQILTTSFWFSIRYLLFLLFLTILFQSLLFVVDAALFLPELPTRLKAFQNRIQEIYPQDLIVTIQEGKLAVNQEVPYYIDIPELQEIDEFDHLVTIDTTADVSAYPTYDTVVLMTDSEIIYPDQDRGNLSSYRVLSLQEVEEDVTIDRSTYLQFIERLSPLFEWIPRIAPVLLIIGIILIPVVGALFGTLWQLFFLLILTSILWIVTRAFKEQLTFSQIYHLGIHGLTVPIILTLLFSLFGVHIPLLFISSFLLWMVIVLSRMKKAS